MDSFLNNTDIISALETKKQEYYVDFRRALKQYYSTEDEENIIRRAHFYYTSRTDQPLVNPQIKKREEEINKYKSARNIIEELFQKNKMELQSYEYALSLIDRTIEKFTITRGSLKKDLSKEVFETLELLSMSTENRKKEILDSFNKSL